MTANWTVSTAEENHAWLLSQFTELLVSRNPKSVLDVGCGAGLLMKNCRAHGIPVQGLDQASPRLEALGAAGFETHAGTAYELPLADHSVDWVTMRHVPHHLEDPGRAFAEALRVMRTGLCIGEPYFDATVATQRGALALDRWEKRQHRRRGMFHAEVLDLGALLSFLPPGFESEYDVEVQHRMRLCGRSLDDFRQDAAELVAALPADHPEHQALADLLVELERLGLSWNGSLCLTIQRR